MHDSQTVGVFKRLRDLQADPRHGSRPGLAVKGMYSGTKIGARRYIRRKPVDGVDNVGTRDSPPRRRKVLASMGGGGIVGVSAPLGDHFCETAPFDELHSVKMDAALAADRVDRDDVRVVKAGRRVRFVLESLQLPSVEDASKRKHLEGDAAT